MKQLRRLLTIISLVLVCIAAGSINFSKNPVPPQNPAQSEIINHNQSSNTPTWETLGMTNLLVAGEESSVTAPTISFRVAANMHPSTSVGYSFIDKHFRSSVPGRLSSDYYVYTLLRLRC